MFDFPSVPRSASSQSVRLFLALSFFAVTFYSYGTALMDYFAFYPSWEAVGADEFPAYHVLIGQRIVFVSVLPFVLLTILNLLLFWFRPASVPRGLVTVSFLWLLVDWASSILIQIPMQLQLETHKDIALLHHLMETNWIRIVAETAQALLAFRMMQRVCRPD
ncbi:MAG: hypothetical protein H7Z41_16120 [Cytophagales bacterium]|nr:hypothetical protein [Armatimonadota bacterium]